MRQSHRKKVAGCQRSMIEHQSVTTLPPKKIIGQRHSKADCSTQPLVSCQVHVLPFSQIFTASSEVMLNKACTYTAQASCRKGYDTVAGSLAV